MTIYVAFVQSALTCKLQNAVLTFPLRTGSKRMRSRLRPVVFEAKAIDHGCWQKYKKMTFLSKIQLLNWQQNVYQSTSCPQNWASVFTSHTNKLQSQVAITFEKHKLDEDCFRARFGRMIRPLWLNTRSTGADVAGTDKTFSSSGCSIWIVASAFSCNHGSSIGTGLITCLRRVTGYRSQD